MKNIVFLLWFIRAGLATASLHAQPGVENSIKFEHLSVDDGLSNSFVWAMLQDSRGFMWFGTAHGLNRFDGYRFTFFGHQGPGTLSDNSVRALFEDHAGKIWVGTRDGGLNKFDPDTQAFTAYQHDPDNANSLSANYVRAIYESPTEPGIFWIGTYGGGWTGLM